MQLEMNTFVQQLRDLVARPGSNPLQYLAFAPDDHALVTLAGNQYQRIDFNPASRPFEAFNHNGNSVRDFLMEIEHELLTHQFGNQKALRLEIGRASCRERV